MPHTLAAREVYINLSTKIMWVTLRLIFLHESI
jgi:hypothetical protein